MLSVKELLSYGSDFLKQTSEIPQKEARILLQYLLDKDSMWLILNAEQKVGCEEEYKKLLQRRSNFEPIEYITQNADFYGENFYVNEKVLIPRPETEILVEKIQKLCKNFKNPLIVEIGCGSGIISIMLAKLIPDAKLYALDISPDALEVAKINAKALHVEQHIEFIQSDLLSNLELEKFDILVSNPPYIADDEPLHVGLSYEPDLALFGGSVGDEILKKIIDEFIQRDIKVLACEMGYDQKLKIREYIKQYNLQAQFYKDLADIDRGFIITKEL
jgi:release factor glutamine methyltransferase